MSLRRCTRISRRSSSLTSPHFPTSRRLNDDYDVVRQCGPRPWLGSFVKGARSSLEVDSGDDGAVIRGHALGDLEILHRDTGWDQDVVDPPLVARRNHL